LSSTWPAGARRWSIGEIESDVAASRADFRQRRLGEPLQRYLDAFDAVEPVLKPLMANMQEILSGELSAQGLLCELWQSEVGRTAFRYLGAPPISDDDLQTLAEAKLGVRALEGDGAAARRLLDVMQVIADPHRFPWLKERREPSESEVGTARLATAVLMASQRVQTLRRGDEKAAVEGSVKGLLIGIGWQPAPSRPTRGIQKLLTDSPPARTFLTQTNMGADNADVIVRLDDDRLLAIECKGSNSEINSRKRLNKEAVQNARAWIGRFGSGQVVPAVALQGVFNARYVAEAQDTPMLVFWAHRLEDLKDFVAGAR